VQTFVLDPFIENLIFLVLGSGIGFLGSVGFFWYQQRASRKSYCARLKQELELIEEQIKSHMKSETLMGKAFNTEFFILARQTLVANVDAETWDLVLKAYSAIDFLRSGSEGSKYEAYTNAIKAIDNAVKAL
jgi:hypothetical protein